MFKIEDIAMLIKSCSEKKLKEFLNIKDLEYSHLDSSSIPPREFANKSTIKFRIFFKIKQCVNSLELSDNINSIITEGLCLSLNIDYKANWFMESTIHAGFKIRDFKILNCSKTKVGIRGNVKYIYLSIYISNDLNVVSAENSIEFKIKNAIRNNKLSQLRIG